jgi:limonene-1,2-epoxide hydrolase
MNTEIHLNPRLVVERLNRAMNDQDVDAFVECFDPLYRTEQPLHPDKGYRGRDKLRRVWAETFKRLPDFHVEVIRTAVDHNVVWAEMRWTGTQRDKVKVEMVGVSIFGVRDNRIIWSRAYIEPLQHPGGGIEAVAG